MKNLSEQQVILNKVAEHVTKEFGLGDDYRIMNFKAKDLSMTLACAKYEVTVKCTGMAYEMIMDECKQEFRRIQEEREALEEDNGLE